METMNGLKEFLYVAENRGFSSAARELKTSKSHISKKVALLEDSLQTRLFNRTTRKMTLTETGQLLYERCRPIFTELDEIHSEITHTQIEPRGTLRVSVAGAFAEKYLAEAFSEFLKTYPEVKIEMYFTDRYVDLIEESFDLAVRYGILDNTSHIAKKIVSRQEFLCASPEYLRQNGTPQTPQDLQAHNCLVGTSDRWNFTINKKNKSIKVKGNWKSNNGRALSHAVKSSLGIAMLPGVYIFDDIQNGNLVPLLEDYSLGEQNVWIVYPHKKYLSGKTRILINYLTEYFNQNYPSKLF